MVGPFAYLQVPTVWEVPTSAIPEEHNTTSHMHLTFYSSIHSVVGTYNRLVPTGVGNKA